MLRSALLRLASASGAVLLGVTVPVVAVQASTGDPTDPDPLSAEAQFGTAGPTAEPSALAPERPEPPPSPAQVSEPAPAEPMPPPSMPVEAPVPAVPAPPPVELPPPGDDLATSTADPSAQVAPEAMPAPAAMPAAPPDPPGNNGTVKVDGLDFDSHPDNEPHVGCCFQIDFYGYDEGELFADITFEGVAPTGGGVLLTDTVFIGEDPAGGGTDLDASVFYNLGDALADVTPHPVQGHHVKLTVHAEGSQGADTKHKVFWVEGCGKPPEEPPVEPPPTTPPGEPPPTTPPTSPPPTAPPPTPPPVTAPPTMSAVSPPEFVSALPVQPAAAPERPSQVSLPRTGSEPGPLVAIGIVLVSLGVAAVAVARGRTTV